jgi:transcriptional regulator with GAF, ATPase, and Fis domain
MPGHPAAGCEDGAVDVENQPHLVEIVAALKEITAQITSAASISEAVSDITKVVTGILPSSVQCGVMMIAQGEPATFASTGVSLELLDESTHSDGEGPAIEAIRSRDIVMSQDVENETRWPTWTALARSRKVASVLSYPFDVDTLTLGALNLYADQPGAFTGDIPIIAMLVADHASLLLRVRLRQLTQEDLLARTGDTPIGEATVERAVGIVMAQRGCPPDQALRHLHEAATHLGVGLPAVAERLVETVSARAQ